MIIGVTSDAGGGGLALDPIRCVWRRGATGLSSCLYVCREEAITDGVPPVVSSVVKVGMPQVHIPATHKPL